MNQHTLNCVSPISRSGGIPSGDPTEQSVSADPNQVMVERLACDSELHCLEQPGIDGARIECRNSGHCRTVGGTKHTRQECRVKTQPLKTLNSCRIEEAEPLCSRCCDHLPDERRREILTQF